MMVSVGLLERFDAMFFLATDGVLMIRNPKVYGTVAGRDDVLIFIASEIGTNSAERDRKLVEGLKGFSKECAVKKNDGEDCYPCRGYEMALRHALSLIETIR